MLSLHSNRGISSVGRAFEWHSKGQEFDSPMLHKTQGLEVRLRSLCFPALPEQLPQHAQRADIQVHFEVKAEVIEKHPGDFVAPIPAQREQQAFFIA